MISTKSKILSNIVPKRYNKLSPLEVAQYFQLLTDDDKSVATAALLQNNNTIAKQKIMEYMTQQLDPIIDSYMQSGSIPTTIVDELLS